MFEATAELEGLCELRENRPLQIEDIMFLAENKMNHLTKPAGTVNILLIFSMDFEKVIHP